MSALRMRTVRVPGWLIERTDADERRDAIVALASTGLPAGEIARRLGVPKSTVRKRLRQSVGEHRIGATRILAPRAV
jgi:DNA-binding NarL/FixJ family response regulator